jgi:hypothetical protein
MRMSTILSIALVLGLLSLPAAPAQNAHPSDGLQNLTITAFIDGRDWFYLTPQDFHWHHLDWVAVGHFYGNWPTGLSMDEQAPNTQYISWIPIWPCNDWRCYFEAADSSSFVPEFPLLSQYQLTGLKVIQAPSGGSVSVYQYPSSDNGYTTIIDFNDDPPPGPHWYRVLLTFSGV